MEKVVLLSLTAEPCHFSCQPVTGRQSKVLHEGSTMVKEYVPSREEPSPTTRQTLRSFSVSIPYFLIEFLPPGHRSFNLDPLYILEETALPAFTATALHMWARCCQCCLNYFLLRSRLSSSSFTTSWQFSLRSS